MDLVYWQGLVLFCALCAVWELVIICERNAHIKELSCAMKDTILTDASRFAYHLFEKMMLRILDEMSYEHLMVQQIYNWRLKIYDSSGNDLYVMFNILNEMKNDTNYPEENLGSIIKEVERAMDVFSGASLHMSGTSIISEDEYQSTRRELMDVFLSAIEVLCIKRKSEDMIRKNNIGED